MILKIIIAITIHILIPLIGLKAFWQLKKDMDQDEIPDPPIIDLFLIFVTYGGLLLVTLTSLFWEWSGLASLGTFYLILGAPIAMGVIGSRQYKKRKISIYHNRVYQLSLLYFIVAPLIFLILFSTEGSF